MKNRQMDTCIESLSRHPDGCLILAQISGFEVKNIDDVQRARDAITSESYYMRISKSKKLIEINTDKCKDLSDGQFTYIIAHEAMHVLLGHNALWSKINKSNDGQVKRLKYAADCAVFSVLENTPFSNGAVDDGVRPSQYGLPNGLDAMQYFRRLEKAIPDFEVPKITGSGSEEDGQGGDTGKTEETDAFPDDADFDDVSEEDSQNDIETLGKDMAIQGMASSMGVKLPGGIGSSDIQNALSRVALKGRRNYRTEMKRFLTSMSPSEHISYARPNRRHLWRGMMLPSRVKEEHTKPLCLMIDVSGSMPDMAVSQAYEILNSMFFGSARNDPEWFVDIFQFTSRIVSETRYKATDFPLRNPERKARGGTRGMPLFDMMKDRQNGGKTKYGGYVILSDGGFGDYAQMEKNQWKPKAPILWIIDGRTTLIPKQYGRIIEV